MRTQAIAFHRRVRDAVGNDALQDKLAGLRDKFVGARARAVAAYDGDSGAHEAAAAPAEPASGDASADAATRFERLRDDGAAIRDRVLDNLDVWLERFEETATARGAQVLWAKDGREICAHVIAIARRHGVQKIIKSKSMLSEEAQLNAALAAAGIVPVETDLGEYILQIAGDEAPSHILAPATHKNLAEVADLFAAVHGSARKTDIGALTREARDVLRRHFLDAGMGLSGGNFLIAETGSVALVTNEGNGRMVTTLPKVHVVVTGIEKIVPTLDDFAVLLRLLTRSATGQDISNYVSLCTGTRGEGDADGPEHTYFVLVDNGRAGVVGGEFRAMLRCIRCGACMNHCPVYQTVGGHAYGGVYPGPMGAVLTPLLSGIGNAGELAQASTLCGQCAAVCPVRIPLPQLLRKLREQEAAHGLAGWRQTLLFAAWRWLALHPAAWSAATRLGARWLRRLAGDRGRISRLPLAGGWTAGRDFPAPEGKTFRELYKKRQEKKP